MCDHNTQHHTTQHKEISKINVSIIICFSDSIHNGSNTFPFPTGTFLLYKNKIRLQVSLEMAVFFTEELCIFAIVTTPIGAKIYIFCSGTFYYGCVLIFSATGCFTHCVLALERGRHTRCDGGIHSNNALSVSPYYIWKQRI